MRKFIIAILLVSLLLTCLFSLFANSAGQLPELENGREYNSLTNHPCMRVNLDESLSLSFIPTSETETDDLCLIISDITSFELDVNGIVSYSFEGSPSTMKMHSVSIGEYVKSGELNDICIICPNAPQTIKCLIGSKLFFEKCIMYAQIGSAILLGFYLAIITTCFLLYVKKPSETYLVYMIAFTIAVAFTSLIYSPLPMPNFGFRAVLNSGYLNALSKALFLLLSLKLLKIEIFAKKEALKTFIFIVLLFVVTVLLNKISTDLRKKFLDLIGYTASIVVIIASYKRKPHAEAMLVGTILTFAIMIYASEVNFGRIKPPLLMYFFHPPGFYYACFDFTCLYVVGCIFAEQFSMAEQLFLEVESANHVLDAKVRERTIDLERLNQQLIQEQKDKHAMMTNLFHDLRNPLFCASGYAEIIGAACPEAEEDITVLKRQLSYLSHLTENLFLMAKLEEKQITFHMQAINFGRLCCITAEEMLPEFQKKKQHISIDMPDDLNVTGDGFRLKQALTNLLENEVQHTPENTEIFLSAYKEESRISLIIEDNGSGISAETMEHLFERYYSSSLDSKSSGLGLAITKEIIEAHEGSIRAENRPEGGARFILEIPERNNMSEIIDCKT